MKAIRLHIKQNSANYKKEETVQCKMTYPLPPYSTVIGAIHKACGYTSYHPMKVSVQGKYGSLQRKKYIDYCFLNRVDDDRNNTLVKMKNPDMLSSAYQVVAEGLKKNIHFTDIHNTNIKVVNEKLLEEYRFLKRTKSRIDKHKKLIKKMKAQLKNMKTDKNISVDEIKAFDKRIKHIESVYDEYVKVKYTQPFSYFRMLAKGTKYYELLYDIELVIHIVSDDSTMADILNNIGNLTAIGRGEDFVEVLECVETELSAVDQDVDEDDENKFFDAYMPVEYLEKNQDSLDINSLTDGGYVGGTKYLLPKDYTVEQIKGGMRKRNFNKIATLFCKLQYLDKGCEDIMLDKTESRIYPVFLA